MNVHMQLDVNYSATEDEEEEELGSSSKPITSATYTQSQ